MIKLNVQEFKVCNEVVGNRGISWCALITDDGALT